MSFLPEDRRFKILLAIGACLVAAIIFVLMVGFKIDDNAQTLKIGFVISGDIQESTLSAAHYEGMKAACDGFGIELLVRDKVAANSGQCPIAVAELINEDAGMIFLAGNSYPSEIREIAENNPNVAFATNSTAAYAKNMTAYFVRMYQAQYLTGALAAMKTKSNVIGCIAPRPVPKVYCGISAFALGAQRINPNVRVVVSNNNSEALIKAGADVLLEKNGELREAQSDQTLASADCHWDLFYRDVIRRYLKGELNVMRNHWIGVQEGVVEFSDISSSVTPEMQARIQQLQQEILDGKIIFSGEIVDNKGNVHCAAGEAISDNVLLEKFDWLVRGVEVLD